MTPLALDPLWNDVYTAGGFWVGVVGLFVGVAGFWIAIVQIREARRAAEKGQEAAEAARDAANKTLAESKDAYERFVGAFASRLLSELEAAVSAGDWRLARFRCSDLAELLASLPTGRAVPPTAAREQCVLALRFVAQKLSALNPEAATDMPRPVAAKWALAVRLTHAILDQLRKPFREVDNGPAADRDPAPPTAGVGPRAPDKDKGTAGELGPGARP